MGRMAPAMLAEVQKKDNELYPLQTISYPGATKQYAHRTVSSRGFGMYAGRVLKWGSYNRGTLDRAYSLEPTQLSLTIDDTPDASGQRFFAELLEGVNGMSVEDSAASTTLCSPNVDPADWFTLCTTIIEDYGWEGLAYTLRLRSDDRALRREFPKDTITQANWPNAATSVRGRPWPLLYGEMDSGGAGGAVPTLLVDQVGFRYGIAAGHLKAVPRVLVDKIQVTSGFSIVYPVVGGRVYTLVKFDSSQGDKQVTVDAQGYETVGDGSGTLITNPMDELIHLLVNWIIGDYKNGPWLSSSTAPIDAARAAAAATFLGNRGHKGSRYIAGEKRGKGKQIVDEWLNSFKCRAFWSNLGKIVFRFEDHATPNVYVDNPWLKWSKDLGALKLRYDTQQRIDRVAGSYCRNEVQGDYTQSLEVRHPWMTKDAPDSLEMAWSHGKAA